MTVEPTSPAQARPAAQASPATPAHATSPNQPVIETAAGAPARLRTGLNRVDRLALGGLVLLALALRLPTIGRGFWVDEGISVGIASHRVSEIPGLLRQDGSPPLFYVLLHFWIRLFGTSEIATHLLPLGISLLVVPLGYWSARELFDRRAGLIAAVLFATNPFLAWYSTETRMYTLVVALATVAVTLAWRAVRDRSPRDAALAVLTYAALLYTHNWSIYLTVVTSAVLFGLAWFRRDRILGLGVAAATAGVVLLWLPWAPTFLAQASSTAAPWAVRPSISDFLTDPASALGGTIGTVTTPVLIAAAVWAWRRGHLQRAPVVGLIGAIGVLSTLAGFLGAQLEPSWTIRYLAIIVAPILLAGAGALSTSRPARLTVAAVCGVLVLWSAIGSSLPNASARYAKSNVGAVGRQFFSQLRPGDVVVVTQTEQVPVLSHYLPPGLVYVTPTGPVPDPRIVDWRNLVHRLQTASPCALVAPSIDGVPIGGRVLEVDPARRLGASGSAWSRAVSGQIAAVDSMLGNDPALMVTGYAAPGAGARPFSPVVGVLYQKTRPVAACG